MQLNPHITNLAKRLSSAVYAVRNIRQLTDILPYGILLWGHGPNGNNIYFTKESFTGYYNMSSREYLIEHFKEMKI